MKNIVLSVFILFSSFSYAGEDIGFGLIKGIKVGNDNVDQLSVYLEDGYTHNGRGCNGVISVRLSDISSHRYQQITSVLLTAYMGGKKVRLHSHLASGCNATFVALQEEDF